MTTEIDALAPEPEVCTLASGSVVRIERLKTRQLFRLLRIITSGGAGMLSQMDFDASDQEAFVGSLLGLVLFSIPEAEDETIEFLKSMVAPAELRPGSSKAAREFNEKAWEALHAELDNPELDDLVTVVEKIVKTEGPDIQALGKRLGSMLEVVRKKDSSPSSGPA